MQNYHMLDKLYVKQTVLIVRRHSLDPRLADSVDDDLATSKML